MTENKSIGRDDIPTIEEIKLAVLAQLTSGRQRSFESVEKEAESFLKVSIAHKKYKIKGSETTLLDNRFKKACAQLVNESFVAYPSKGKIKLTKKGRLFFETAAIQLENKPGTTAPNDSTEKLEGSSYPSSSHQKEDGLEVPVGGVLQNQQVVSYQVGLDVESKTIKDQKLGSRRKESRAKQESKKASKLLTLKTTIGLGICALALGMILVIGSCTNGASQHEAEAGNGSQKSDTALSEAAKGTLSFKVISANSVDAATPIKINITGPNVAGKIIDDHREAKIGIVYPLDYEAGSYTFNVSPDSLTNGKTIFNAISTTYEFDGKTDQVVNIVLTEDIEATEAVQRAAKETEEKAAQQAAEKKRIEAAAADALTEEGASSPAEVEPISKTVYITETGKKYHREGCRYLKKSKIAISYDDARAQGYEPCAVCNPG